MQELGPLSGVVVTMEENALAGGFGAQVCAWLEHHGHLDRVRMIEFGIPDDFVEHGPREKLLDLVGLTTPKIYSRLREQVGRVALPAMRDLKGR